MRDASVPATSREARDKVKENEALKRELVLSSKANEHSSERRARSVFSGHAPP